MAESLIQRGRAFIHRGRHGDEADPPRVGEPTLWERVEAARLAGCWQEGRPLRLNLGCGSVHLDGWCNIDGDPDACADVRWDLRQGLPLPRDAATRIYSEHFFEHLELDEGKRLFAECRAALCRGGVFRIAMPDLDRVVKNYRGPWREVEVLKDPAYNFIDTNAHYINVAFRYWGHRYLYDFDDLELRLRDAGFDQVVRCSKGRSVHSDLCDLETRAESWLVAEATA
jgi:predicted SAM-dependent methyltransferase